VHPKKTTTKIRVFFIAAVLISCAPKKRPEKYQPVVDSVAEEATHEFINSTESPIDSTVQETTESYDCPRGQAESVVKKAVYPHSIFKLNDDNRTGTETVTLDNDDQLIIKSGGCEYYLLTFRFETTRFNGDTTDITFWLDKAVILMNEIEKGIDVPIDISGGSAAASKLAKEKRNYLLGEEIVYKEGSVRGFVTFDRIQKIDDARFAIEISYASGPY